MSCERDVRMQPRNRWLALQSVLAHDAGLGPLWVDNRYDLEILARTRGDAEKRMLVR